MLTKIYTFCTTPRLRFTQLLAGLAALISVRIVVDFFVHDIAALTPYRFFFEFTHAALFFLLTFITLAWFVGALLHRPLREMFHIFLWGFLLIPFPPILDRLISVHFLDNIPFRSYYLFDSVSGLITRFFTFFGDSPTDGITYGTRIMIAVALVLICAIAWHLSRSIVRTFGTVFGSYVIFFVLSSIPALIAFSLAPLSGTSVFAVDRALIASIFLSPTTILASSIPDITAALNVKMSLIYALLTTYAAVVVAWRARPTLTRALIKNLRLPQVLYHLGLLAVGAGMALYFVDAIVLSTFFTVAASGVLALAVLFAWASALLFNDVADIAIDRVSNPLRPLPQGLLTVRQTMLLGTLALIASLVFAALVSPIAALALLFYHGLSWIYNMPPLRLKRVPGIATFLAAWASLAIIAVGWLATAPTHTFAGFPFALGILLLIAYTLCLPIKDFRDREGDAADGVWTLPVLLGERVARLVVGAALFLTFFLSVIFTREQVLLVPALIAGSLSFFALVAQKNQHLFRVPAHKIVPTIFAITFLYGLFLVGILFL